MFADADDASIFRARCFLTTSKDMTAKLYTLHPVEGFRPKTFAGHKDQVMNAYFAKDGQTVG